MNLCCPSSAVLGVLLACATHGRHSGRDSRHKSKHVARTATHCMHKDTPPDTDDTSRTHTGQCPETASEWVTGTARRGGRQRSQKAAAAPRFPVKADPGVACALLLRGRPVPSLALAPSPEARAQTQPRGVRARAEARAGARRYSGRSTAPPGACAGGGGARWLAAQARPPGGEPPHALHPRREGASCAAHLAARHHAPLPVSLPSPAPLLQRDAETSEPTNFLTGNVRENRESQRKPKRGYDQHYWCVGGAESTAPQRLGSRAAGTERHASGRGSRRSLTLHEPARRGYAHAALACVHAAGASLRPARDPRGPTASARRRAAAGTRARARRGSCPPPR